MFSFRFPVTIIYMMQSTEYEARPYLAWFWRTTNFSTVANRRSLQKTKRAKLLLLGLILGIILQIMVGITLCVIGFRGDQPRLVIAGIVLLLSYPLVWSHIIIVLLEFARVLVVKPKQRKVLLQAAKKFHNTKAVKIAVAGSFGKTTMKELLMTVLGESKNVAATPGNKNVVSSHAAFAARLKGDEDILIIEYGEGEPGDVPRFNALIEPTIGVITGLAPAHLDKYKTVRAAGEDIFRLAEFVGPRNVFVNKESPDLEAFIKETYYTYDRKSVLGWKITRIKVDITGTSFVMKKNKKTLKLKSGLVGEHLVGPTAFCAALAVELGLTDEEIIAGVSKTKPFEHRMQPRPLAGGWIIDDTYNGNLEGVRAGLELLEKLKAERKTYVTPGLVDQGAQAEDVHITMGHLIAKANPNRVILMQNSSTEWIKTGLHEEKYNGEVTIETEPLRFYTNLEHFIAVGDLVMMQNDLPDNYK